MIITTKGPLPDFEKAFLGFELAFEQLTDHVAYHALHKTASRIEHLSVHVFKSAYHIDEEVAEVERRRDSAFRALARAKETGVNVIHSSVIRASIDSLFFKCGTLLRIYRNEHGIDPVDPEARDIIVYTFRALVPAFAKLTAQYNELCDSVDPPQPHPDAGYNWPAILVKL